MKNKSSWVELLYGPYFKVIGFFYRTYKGNRERLSRLKKKPWLANSAKLGMLLTVLVWIAIWFFASEESRNSLTEEFRESVQGVSSLRGQ